VKNPLTPYQISLFFIHRSPVENLWKSKIAVAAILDPSFPHVSTTRFRAIRGKVENLFSTVANKGLDAG